MVAALSIAVVKMLLVALFFMHIRHSDKLTKLVVLGRPVVAGASDRPDPGRRVHARLAGRSGEVE